MRTRDFLSVCHCAQVIKIIPFVFGDSKGIYLVFNVPLRPRSLTVFNFGGVHEVYFHLSQVRQHLVK